MPTRERIAQQALTRRPRGSFIGAPWADVGLTGEQWIARFLDNPNDPIFNPYRDLSGDDPQGNRVVREVNNAIFGGPLHPTNYQYTDPRVKAYVDNAVYSNALTDSYSFLGDQFGPAVALLGLAGGGAALAGGFGAAGAGGAGAGAAGTGTAGAGSGALGIGGTAADFAAAGAGGLGAAGGATAPGLGAGLLAPTLGAGEALALGGGTAGTIGGTAGLGGAGGAGALGTGGAGAGGLAGVGGAGGAGTAGATGGILGTGLTFKDAAGLALTGAGIVNGVVQGNNASEAQDRAADAAKLQADIALQLFGEATPLRQSGITGLNTFLNTGALPTGLLTGLDDVRRQGREDLESQFRVARENVIGTTPARGGQLNQALINLEDSRARAVGGFDAGLRQQFELPLRAQLFNQAVNAGFGQPQVTLAGLGSAGTQLGGIANAATQQATGAGQTAGSLAALALKKQQLQQQNTGRSSTSVF